MDVEPTVWLRSADRTPKRFRCTDSKLQVDAIAHYWGLDSWTITIGDHVLERTTSGESRPDIMTIRKLALEAGLGDGRTRETALVIWGRVGSEGQREEGEAYWGSSYLLSLAPSSCDHKKARKLQQGLQPAVLNYRPPHNTPPLPLQLAHPVFGQFLDVFYGVEGAPKPGKKDYEAFVLLSSECSWYVLGEDASYRSHVRDYWANYVGLELKAPFFTGKVLGDTFEDAGYESEIRVNLRLLLRALVLLLETEVSMCGISTDPAFELDQHYRLYWEKVGSKAAFARSCFPALGIEHIGPFLRVSGLINLEQTCSQPLTPFINLLTIQKHDLRAAEYGARLCLAVKLTSRGLDSYYRKLADGEGGVPRDYFEQGVPYPLHYSRVCPVRWGDKLVFLIKEENLVVKYVQREYGEAVHRAWAQQGLAPELLAVKSVPGGWTEIRMEYLGRGWKCLQELKQTADTLRPQVLQALRRAHGIPVGSSAGVHGDMRDINVMVKTSNAGELESVKFIDFDWAREIGGCYPSFMNHDGVNWPCGVADGLAMLQEHDVALLSTPQQKQMKQTV